MPANVVAYVIHEGSFPSMLHARFLDEELAKAEVKRLNDIAIARNKQIDENPSTGRGACFMNMKREVNWSYKRMEFPS